jgi:VWFA-related protein
MDERLRRLVGCLAVTVFTLTATGAQSLPGERPKLKNFGSSLDRLEWDDKKQAAVETKRRATPGSTDDDVIRVETDLVVCDVQVRDKRGKTVIGLTKDDFIITEDNQPQQIQHFSLGNDLTVGRSIVLLIDYSDSMSPFIETSVKAAKMLVDQLGPKDIMAIVTDDVKLLVDFTRDKVKLKEGLDHLRHRVKWGQVGLSRQFSALLATARELFTNEDLRRIIIFQTDGDEADILRNGPMDWAASTIAIERRATWRARWPIRKFSLENVYKAVEESRASVYAVIPTRLRSDGDTWKIIPAMESNLLMGWYKAAAGAAIGGWTAFLRRPDEAIDIYSAILADINSRYVIRLLSDQ